jgi:hypothetical protein
MKTVQHDLIKLRAYEIWELGGYPHGLDKNIGNKPKRSFSIQPKMTIPRQTLIP